MVERNKPRRSRPPTLRASTKRRLVKIERPRVDGAIRRPRLELLLDEAVRRPITWLGAPAGAGKTTVAAQWVQAVGRPCLWYQLGEEDNDPATFFYHLGLATKRVSRRRKELPLLLPDNRASGLGFARLFFQELFAQLPQQAIVVFDNAESAAEVCHPLLAAGLALVPPGVSVLLAGRGDLPPAFATLRAHRQVSEIDAAQVRFSAEESRQAAAVILHELQTTLDSAQAAHIVELADGWVGGLVLLLEWARRDVSLVPVPFDLTTPGLFDFFTSDVFSRVDAETQNFLLRTAVLPTLTPSIAALVSGRRDAGQMLARLHRQHFFTERQGGSPVSYRYHPFFRQFLLAHLRVTCPESEVVALESRAGNLLYEAGHCEEAIPLLLRAGCHDVSATLILEIAAAMYGQGRAETLRHWLEQLPEECIVAQPWLLYWQAVCRLAQCAEEGRPLLEQALDALEAAGDADGAFTAWAGLVEADLLAFTSLPVLDARQQRLERLLERFGTASSQVEGRVLAARFVALSFREPSHPDLRELGSSALAMARRSGDLTQQLSVGAALVVHWALSGNVVLAQEVHDACSALDPALCQSIAVRQSWRFSLAMHYLLSGRCEDALKLMEAALVEARDTAVTRGVELVALGVIAAVMLEDAQRARMYWEELEQLRREGVLPAYIGYVIMGLWMAWFEGQWSRARDLAQQAVDKISQFGHGQGSVAATAMLAQTLIKAGEHAEAGRLVDAALSLSPQPPNAQYVLSLLAADVRLAAGDEVQARQQLCSAFALGRRQQFLYGGIAIFPATLARLCMHALGWGIETDYVRELVRTLGLRAPTGVHRAHAWPWRLAISTLGGFSLVIDGAPLPRSRKEQRKPLELLKALVAAGGSDVEMSRLAAMLWPASKPISADQALVMALRRLRRMLPDADLLVRTWGKLTLDPARVWTDVGALSLIYRGIGDKIASQDDAGLLELSDQLFALYQGDFLQGEDLPFALPVRQRLRTQFVQLVARMAEYWQIRGAPQRARECCARALAVAPGAAALQAGQVHGTLKIDSPNAAN